MKAELARALNPKSLVLHPFLLAMYVVLAPLAENIDPVGLQAIRGLLVAVLAAAVVSANLGRIPGDSVRGGLLTSGIVLWFGSYGHLTELLSASLNLGDWIGGVLLVLGLALLVGWGILILGRLQEPGPLNLYINAASRLSVLFPIILGLHLPAGDQDVGPYLSISPVNVFRTVLDRYYASSAPPGSSLIARLRWPDASADFCPVLPLGR